MRAKHGGPLGGASNDLDELGQAQATKVATGNLEQYAVRYAQVGCRYDSGDRKTEKTTNELESN